MPFEKFEKPSSFSTGEEKIDREKESDRVEESFREFLAEQISLPEKSWSQEFKDYVGKKYQEGKEPIPERSPEKEQHLTFERYLKGLDLKEEDLKNKRILDLGCGEKGEFVRECLKRRLTAEAFGLDLKVRPKERFIQGDFEKKIPLGNLDYIISFGGIEAPASVEDVCDPKKTLENALNSLKQDGEIRIYPLRKAPPESELKGIEFSRKKWQEILEGLSLKGKIEYELRPIDIRVSGKKPDVWLEEILIIKKK